MIGSWMADATRSHGPQSLEKQGIMAMELACRLLDGDLIPQDGSVRDSGWNPCWHSHLGHSAVLDGDLIPGGSGVAP